MKRLSRSYIYNRIISDVSFDRELKHKVSRAALYEIADRFAALVCSDSVMVVQAMQDNGPISTAGRFGLDEPWPDWVERIDLVRERLADVPRGDGWTDSG